MFTSPGTRAGRGESAGFFKKSLNRMFGKSTSKIIANVGSGYDAQTLNAVLAASLGNGTSGQAIVGDGTGNFSLGSVGGVYARIAQVVTSGSASTITFSSIPATYSDLEIKFLGRATGAVGTINVFIRFNGDNTATNYNKGQTLTGNGTSVGTSVINGTTNGGILANVTGTSSAVVPITVFTSTIAGYAQTVMTKAVITNGYDVQGNASPWGQVFNFGAVWISTAAINQIEIIIASGSFLDGTICTLYGLG